MILQQPHTARNCACVREAHVLLEPSLLAISRFPDAPTFLQVARRRSLHQTLRAESGDVGSARSVIKQKTQLGNVQE